MTPGSETAPAQSLPAAEEKPAAASSNLVPPAGVEQLRRRCCGMQVENCRQELGKPLAFSSAHSPQRRPSKLLGPPSREFDRSVFGPPRSLMTRAAPELPGYSKLRPLDRLSIYHKIWQPSWHHPSISVADAGDFRALGAPFRSSGIETGNPRMRSWRFGSQPGH